MSKIHSHPAFDIQPFTGGTNMPQPTGERSLPGRHSDRAIDAALRSVPIPEGMMSRLGQLVATLSDKSADHADWLGC
jgi:hypothetical protein